MENFVIQQVSQTAMTLGQSVHLIVEIQVLLIFGALVTCDIEPTTSGLHMIVCMKVCPETKCHGNSEII